MCTSAVNSKGTNTDEAVPDYLKTVFDDNAQRDYPASEFIKLAWGLDAKDVPQPEGGYLLDATSVSAYIDNEYLKTMAIKTEKSAYVPLMKIFKAIIAQVVSASGMESAKIPSIVDMRGRVVEGNFTAFKPDFLWSWLPESAKHSWFLAALSGEIKKNKLEMFDFQTQVDLQQILVCFGQCSYTLP